MGYSIGINVERIGDFCNPNPVQYFHCEMQSEPNPVVLSKYLILSGFNPISISDPVEFFSKFSPIRDWF